MKRTPSLIPLAFVSMLLLSLVAEAGQKVMMATT